MLEPAVGDGAEKLWLQQEIPETSRVNADVTTLFVRVTSRDSQIALLCCGSIGGCWSGCCCVVRLEFLVGIVNEIFFMRHVVERWKLLVGWRGRKTENIVELLGRATGTKPPAVEIENLQSDSKSSDESEILEDSGYRL